ncbi:hypothetical protein [Truepera radiovictrix]|uniref:Uncharacterized protein n=1 Tax=Truepera radiovictrix (strain DSM 17093 / CIP 108686 / LMG 22925 / RQ-24) TaxID=649638 RepID=D7CTC7_TRURR|nr:hypothetical protein [Truepera radiovictrix]ADI13784.1 hypothetical protein Trad_0648 [Truepera radiovictrix DSM 17093]WMT57650.1 hypothetical protein RCV51_01580 [Truepera radiovictrix]
MTGQQGTQQIEQLLHHDLTLKQLIGLANTVKETRTLSPVQRTRLLRNISRRIWQRSVCEYDGY